MPRPSLSRTLPSAGRSHRASEFARGRSLQPARTPAFWGGGRSVILLLQNHPDDEDQSGDDANLHPLVSSPFPALHFGFAFGRSTSDAWQYGTRIIKAGETIETREWPHPSFFPLNYAAQKVPEFFNTRQKSRLPKSPCHGDRLRLSDGLSGPGILIEPTLP
jgi:hypothetical protein